MREAGRQDILVTGWEVPFLSSIVTLSLFSFIKKRTSFILAMWTEGQSGDFMNFFTCEQNLARFDRRSSPSLWHRHVETEGMFILSRLSDTVKLLPSTEYSPAAVTHWLNAKYSNRVLHKVGLCIAVYDILSVGDGALKYGDGCVYIKSSNPSNIVSGANGSRVSDDCV